MRWKLALKLAFGFEANILSTANLSNREFIYIFICRTIVNTKSEKSLLIHCFGASIYDICLTLSGSIFLLMFIPNTKVNTKSEKSR